MTHLISYLLASTAEPQILDLELKQRQPKDSILLVEHLILNT